MTEGNGEKVGGEGGDKEETGKGFGEKDEKKRWRERGGETGKGEGHKRRVEENLMWRRGWEERTEGLGVGRK